MTMMINTEPRFAGSKLVEIAKAEVETKTLILPQGKKWIVLCHPSVFAINFSICAVLFVSSVLVMS